jgi:hypothetical protein
MRNRAERPIIGLSSMFTQNELYGFSRKSLPPIVLFAFFPEENGIKGHGPACPVPAQDTAECVSVLRVSAQFLCSRPACS